MMSLLLPVLALLAPSAHATPVNVEVCLQFNIEFEDDWGDFWADNTVHRIARGVQIRVTDDDSTDFYYLDDSTGCKDITVDVSGPSKNYQLVARTKAQVNGVDIETHASDDPDYDVRPIHTVSWTVSANDKSITKTLPPTARWQVLAVGTWIFNRNDFDLASGPTRDCCTSGYDADGTCASPDYEPVEDTVHYFIDTDGTTCGGKSNFDNQPNAIKFRSTCLNKQLWAHETGHLVVMMRMGGRTDDERDAGLNKCMGDWRIEETSPIDTGHDATARGVFTKEYMSVAFREGWGEFFTTWAWNRRTESDCEFMALKFFSDFDLDGEVDNDVATGQDFLMDCVGTPFIGTDPTPCAMDDENWLDDLEAYADDAGCQAAGAQVDYNRSTVYDVMKFFWVLTSDSTNPIDPSDLAEIYIDMCPRGWSGDDTEYLIDSDEGPLYRLDLAAEAHPSIETQVKNAADDHL